MFDPAAETIDVIRESLLDVFSPDSTDPPARGSHTVHFFAGEGPARAAWTAHTSDPGCDEPFIWVRVANRYRTRSIPETAVEVNACGLPTAAEVEIGVGRCAVMDMEPSWDDYEAEGVESLDDSRRIEVAGCAAVSRLTDRDYIAVSEPVLPFGPEGGTIGWSIVLHVQF